MYYRNIDTLRFMIRAKQLETIIDDLSLLTKEPLKLKNIGETSNGNFKKTLTNKLNSDKYIKELKVVEYSSGKVLPHYIIVIYSKDTVLKSSIQKQSKGYYCYLELAGLNSYSKLDIKVLQVKNYLVEHCKVYSFDIAIDYELDFNSIFKVLHRLSSYGKVRVYKNSIYINKPEYKHIAKIKIYDKSYKENLKGNLTRVELSFYVNSGVYNIKELSKLDDINLCKYYDEVSKVYIALNT